MPKIEIIKDKKSHKKKIFIDGKDFSSLVAALDIRETAGSATIVTLEMLPSEVHIYEGVAN